MNTVAFIPLFLDNLGGGELLVIMFFVLIFFGSKRIPDLAKGLGKGLRGFRNAMNDVRSDLEQAARLEEQKHEEEQVRPPRRQEPPATPHDAAGNPPGKGT